MAIGVLVLAIGLIWLVLIGPLVAGFSDRAAERDQLRATLQRNARLMPALPVWRAAAEAQRATSPRFSIAAPSEQLAVEALKARVTKLAADEGFAVTGIEDLQADAAPGSIRVRVDMAVSLTQLDDVIRRLESEGSYVVFDYLSITADRSAAAGRLAPIDVRMELSSDWRPVGSRSS